MKHILEPLAKRLVDVAIEADTSSDLGGCSITRNEVKMAVAREVLRQMEWARRHCLNSEVEDYQDSFIDGPVTLAPPDWKSPEE